MYSPYIRKTVIILCILSSSVFGYEPQIGHLPISQIALSEYALCDQQNPTIFKQQIKLRMLQGNKAMDHGTWSFSAKDEDLAYGLLTFHYISRITNWHFYHPDSNIKSRHGKFEMSHVRLWNWAKQGLNRASSNTDKALFLGALVHLTEDISVPAHTIPVFHGPATVKYLDTSGYLSQAIKGDSITTIIKDPIDYIPLDKAAISQYFSVNRQQICKQISSTNHLTVDQIRHQLALKTHLAIEQNIAKCPNVRWSAFWPRNIDNHYFGQYHFGMIFGQSGKLIQDTGNYCQFDVNDSRYKTFVNDRHIDAIIADMQLFEWFKSNFL